MMLLALVLAAAPPPPAPVPQALSAPIDGYDLRTPYQLWRGWVEAQKGAATRARLARPEAVEGYEAVGEPFIQFEKYNDFGHFLTGEIRTYCPRSETRRRRLRNCHYLLRRAYILDDAGDYDDNPVARWTREAFDGPRIAAHFRALGYAPDIDWWQAADREQMFSVLPSAVPMLIQNATVVQLDSRECPALRRTIASVEARRLDWTIDLPTVQPDQRPSPLDPHAVWIVYTLTTLAPGASQAITIRGTGRTLRDFVHPVLDAADACERRRSNASRADE